MCFPLFVCSAEKPLLILDNQLESGLHNHNHFDMQIVVRLASLAKDIFEFDDYVLDAEP